MSLERTTPDARHVPSKGRASTPAKTVFFESRAASAGLSDHQLRKLADAMDEDVVADGEAIVREGEAGDAFYVIAAGKVKVYEARAALPSTVFARTRLLREDAANMPTLQKDHRTRRIDRRSTKDDGVVATLEKGGYFGDRALISEDKRAATCTAVDGPAKLLAIDRDDFHALLGPVEEIMAGNTCQHTAALRQSVIKRQNAKITRGDLSFVCPLGQGAFGKVSRVEHKETGTHYALKAQAKAAIVEQELQSTVLQERDVLMHLDHPFVLKLVCSFQDPKYVYFLLELLPGGELYKHMTKRKRFSEPETKFFVRGAGAVANRGAFLGRQQGDESRCRRGREADGPRRPTERSRTSRRNAFRRNVGFRRSRPWCWASSTCTPRPTRTAT